MTEQQGSTTVVLETRDRVRYVTMNRPERRNALNEELQNALLAALYDAEDDPDVGCIVIRGAGTSFCSGFDITPRAERASGPMGIREDVNSMRAITARMTAIWNLSKPVIASVHGYCVAGGTDLATHCDMIVAAEDAQFGFPPVRAQGGPPTHMWTYHVGPQWAKRMLLTGDFIDGKTAERIGLVLQAVPADQLEAETHELARRVAMIEHGLLAANKSVVNRAVELMGRTMLQEFSRDADAMGHQSPAAAEFARIGRTDGLRAALSWRDDKFRQ
jgi:enoyl-CoA hydratase